MGFLAVLFSLFWSVSNTCRSFRPILFLSLFLCTALQYVIIITAPACAVAVLVFVIVFLLLAFYYLLQIECLFLSLSFL